MRKIGYWQYIQRHTAFKVLIAVIVSAVLYWLSSFLFPILLSIGLAFALYPVSRAFTRMTLGKTGMHPSRVMAIALAFVAFAIFSVTLVSFVVLPLFGQINALIAKLPEYSSRMQSDSLMEIIKDPTALPMLPSSLGGLVEDAINWGMGFISTVVRNLLRSTVSIVTNLFGLIVVPFLAFYFLKDWQELSQMLVDLFNPSARPKVERVLVRIGNAISNYVSGLWKLSLLSGFAVTSILLLLEVPYPLVFGIMAMLAETIPLIGPIIASVPTIFVAYSSVSPHAAFQVAMFYIIYYTIDGKVLVPVVMGRKINLHPVLIILALMIGGKLFGMLGMLFSVPVAAVYRVLYDELWHYNGYSKAKRVLVLRERARRARQAVLASALPQSSDTESGWEEGEDLCDGDAGNASVAGEEAMTLGSLREPHPAGAEISYENLDRAMEKQGEAVNHDMNPAQASDSQFSSMFRKEEEIPLEERLDTPINPAAASDTARLFNGDGSVTDDGGKEEK